MPDHTPPGQTCACGEMTRPDESTILLDGPDGTIHRFSGLPCIPHSPAPEEAQALNPERMERDDRGTWSAFVDGKLVATGPDESIVRAAWEHHRTIGGETATDLDSGDRGDRGDRGEPSVDLDEYEVSTPAAPVAASDLPRAGGAVDLSALAPQVPQLLVDRETGVPYMLTAIDSGVLWECKEDGCASSSTFNDARLAFDVIRNHCVTKHPKAAPPSQCDLADCSEQTAGVVTINVPSVGEESVERTLGICAPHLSMVQSGEIIGFAFVPEYRQ